MSLSGGVGSAALPSLHAAAAMPDQRAAVLVEFRLDQPQMQIAPKADAMNSRDFCELFAALAAENSMERRLAEDGDNPSSAPILNPCTPRNIRS
ncbi:hypothetical protein [Bradyrhizobium sp. USDA 4529]